MDYCANTKVMERCWWQLFGSTKNNGEGRSTSLEGEAASWGAGGLKASVTSLGVLIWSDLTLFSCELGKNLTRR